MNKSVYLLISIVCACTLCACNHGGGNSSAPDQDEDDFNVTPSPPAGNRAAVSTHGQLHVCGNQLCDQFNQPLQLRGMSTHGLQWYGWGDCLTAASLDALAND